MKNHKNNGIEFCDNLEHSITLERSPRSHKLVGTRYHSYLISFLSRAKCFGTLIDLPLIQKAVETISSNVFVKTIGSKTSPLLEIKKCIADPPCRAYFFASVFVGSLDFGLLNRSNKRKIYQLLNSLLKPCHNHESNKVVLAHMAIAWYCQLTFQELEHRRHCGFSRVLICCMDNVDDRIYKAYLLVAFASTLSSLLLRFVEVTVLKLFQRKFSIDAELFRKGYPILTSFMEEDFERDCSMKHDLENFQALHGIFESGNNATLGVLIIMSTRFLHAHMTTTSHSKENILEALNELKDFFEMALLALKLPSMHTENLPPFAMVYFRQIFFFISLLRGNILSAKYLLTKILESFDIHLLACWLARCPMFVHHIHRLIAAAAFLGMEKEYCCFQKRMSVVNSMMNIPSSLPNSLAMTEDECASICNSSECCQFWSFLPSLCLQKATF